MACKFKRQYTVEVIEQATGLVRSYVSLAVSAKKAEANVHSRMVEEGVIDNYLSYDQRHQRFAFQTFLTIAVPDRQAPRSTPGSVQLDLPGIAGQRSITNHGLLL